MFKPFWFFWIFCSLLYSFSTLAQTDEEIILNFLKKQEANLDTSKVKTIFQEFNVNTMGIDMLNKFWRKGEYIRFESDFMGQNSSIVISPTEGWMVQNGMTTEIPIDQIDMYRAQVLNQTSFGNLNMPVELYEKEKEKFKIVGIEKIDNVSCYHIQVEASSPESQEQFAGDFWVDKNNLNLTKLALKSNQNGQEQLIEMVYKDYVVVSNIPFPKKIEIFIDSQKSAEINVKEIKVNEPISDDLFKKE